VVSPLTVEETSRAITVAGDDFRLTFDRHKGRLATGEWNDMAIVQAGPVVNVWRAPTDNDVRMAQGWRKAGLDRLISRLDRMMLTRIAPDRAWIEIDTVLGGHSLRPALACHYRYTVHGSGDLLLEVQVSPRAGLPSLPRIGLEMALPGRLDCFAWYGSGPHESYSDRKESVRVGVYSGTVADQYHPYIRPQEYGNKTDARWAAVTDARGAGLLAIGQPTLNVSVHAYSLENLTRARHTTDLTPDGVTWLYLDHAQCGLGSQSCGPGPLDKYLLPPVQTAFAVRLTPFTGDAGEAARLARALPPSERPEPDRR
jgi:hypothetical protein